MTEQIFLQMQALLQYSQNSSAVMKWIYLESHPCITVSWLNELALESTTFILEFPIKIHENCRSASIQLHQTSTPHNIDIT